MNVSEAFKVGFLLRCAEERLTPDEIDSRVTKAAAMQKQGGIFDALKDLTPGALIALGILPPVAGVVGGYGLAQLRNDPVDLQEMRKREELGEYYRAIDRLSKPHPSRAVIAPTRVFAR